MSSSSPSSIEVSLDVTDKDNISTNVPILEEKELSISKDHSDIKMIENTSPISSIHNVDNEVKSNDRQEIYFDPIPLTDFIIHLHNVDFFVHKMILYQHSEYFQKLFDSHMNKKKRTYDELVSTDKSFTTISTTNKPCLICRCAKGIECINMSHITNRPSIKRNFYIFLIEFYSSDLAHVIPFLPSTQLSQKIWDMAYEAYESPNSPISVVDLKNNNINDHVKLIHGTKSYSKGVFKKYLRFLISLSYHFNCKEFIQKIECNLSNYIMKSETKSSANIIELLRDADMYHLTELKKQICLKLKRENYMIDFSDIALNLLPRLNTESIADIVRIFNSLEKKE